MNCLTSIISYRHELCAPCFHRVQGLHCLNSPMFLVFQEQESQILRELEGCEFHDTGGQKYLP